MTLLEFTKYHRDAIRIIRQTHDEVIKLQNLTMEALAVTDPTGRKIMFSAMRETVAAANEAYRNLENAMDMFRQKTDRPGLSVFLPSAAGDVALFLSDVTRLIETESKD